MILAQDITSNFFFECVELSSACLKNAEQLLSGMGMADISHKNISVRTISGVFSYKLPFYAISPRKQKCSLMITNLYSTLPHQHHIREKM